ncbi:MAG: ABC transporter substrate-binding protein [Pseudomonadota bacterium]
MMRAIADAKLQVGKRMVMILVGSVFLLTSLGFSPVYGGQVRGVTEDLVKIGGIIDLTGPVAGQTKLWAEAWKSYFKDLNEQGGIQGRKIKLIIEDDRYSIPLGIAGFKKLIYRDEVYALLGPTSTGETKALFDQIEKTKTPSFTASLAEEMTTPYRRYIFSLAPSYDDQVKVIFDYILGDLKAKDPRIGFIAADTEFGKEGLRAARKWAEHFGIKLADEEVLGHGDLDATSQILGLKRAKTEYIIVHHGSEKVALCIRDARKYAFSDVLFFATYYGCDEMVVQIAGNAAKNFYGVHSFNSWYDETPGMKKLVSVATKYNLPTKALIKMYIQGWVQAMILAEAIKRQGKNLTLDGFVDAMETIDKFDTGGICGAITFTSKSHKGLRYLRIYTGDLEKERLKPVTDWRKPLE